MNVGDKIYIANREELINHKNDTESHVLQSDKDKWNNNTRVEHSNTNGSILIDDIETNVYTHPAYTGKASGLYKVSIDNTGHVNATKSVTKEDIAGLGVAITDTWRGVQDNLTSESTEESLSANQGRILNAKFGTTLVSTLLVGETTVTFNNECIKNDSTIDIYTNEWGVTPSNVTTENGTITLEFDSQNKDILVKVIVK